MDAFALTYEAFDPDQEGLREALTSTGNGYLCARGTAEWEDADGVHYPGTYAHGVYNRETTILGGLPVLNEDLVNLPNWLVVKVRIEGEDAIRLADVELLDYRHDYDIRYALRPETVLITVMHANNELGTLQPIEEIGQTAAEAGVRFHSDAVQSAGKATLDVKRLGVDRIARQSGGKRLYAAFD